MPTDMTPYQVLVWFTVGLALGGGWTLGAWVLTRLLTLLFR